MAEATTEDLLKAQEETTKKIDFVGNVLNKNIVPASAQKEKDTEDNAWKKKLMASLGSMEEGLGTIGEKIEGGGEGGGGGGGFMKGLKKAALFMLIPLVLAFVNSESFKKLVSFIKDTLIPAIKAIWEWLKLLFDDPMAALKKLWDGMLAGAASIGAWIWEAGIKPFWDWIVGVFTTMDWGALWKKAIEGYASIGLWIWNKAIKPFWTWIVGVFTTTDWGKLWSGLWGAVTSIGAWIWDKAIKPFWTWIKDIFSFKSADAEDDDSKKGVLGFIKDLALGVWKWFKSLFDFSTVGSTFASIVNLITLPYNILLSLVTGVWKWFKGLFGWEEAKTDEAEVDTKPGGIGGMLLTLIKGVWKWFKGLFGWGTTKEPAEGEDSKKGVLGFLKGLVDGVWIWFKGLFSWGTTKKPAEDDDSKSGVIGFLKGLVDGIWAWFKDLFDFSTVGKAFASVLNIIFLPHTILLGLVQGIWGWFKGLFGFDTKDTTDAEVDTKPGGVGGMLLALVQGVWKWFKGLFGWGTTKEPAEGEDSKKGILGYLTSLVSGVWIWFKGLFSWGTDGTGVKPAEDDDSKKGIGGFLKGLVDGIWSWFKGLFDFSSGSAALISIAKLVFLPYTILFDLVDAVWTWFKKLFGFSSEDAEKDPRSGSEKVIDFVIGLPGKIWAWLKKTVLGWFGIEKEGDALVATVDEGTKPESGWLATLFGKIFPEWLTSPVVWAMKKLGLTDASGKLTDAGSTLSEAVKTGGLGSLIGSLFSKLFPEWITSPIKWIKEKIFGTGKEKLTDTTADSFFADWKLPSWDSFKELMPDWLKDPVGWVKNLFGKGVKAGEREATTLQATEDLKATQGVTGKEFKSAQAKNYEARTKEMAGATDVQRADVVAGMGAFERDMGDDTFDQDRISELVVAGMITKEDLEAILRETSEVDLSKIDRRYMNQMLDHIKSREKREAEAAEAQTKMAEQATTSSPGSSLFVYDKHVEKTIKELIQPMIGLAAAQSAMLAAYGGGSGAGSGTTVNNVTVSPSTSNTVSSVQKSENTYGTVDPYTSAAGAYG